MKKLLLLFIGASFALGISAQDEFVPVADDFVLIDTISVATENQNDTIVGKKKKKKEKDIIKKGISFGPLPVIAYDQDKGFQFGGLLNIYDFGDGSHYPHPKQQWYIEASAFTKGTQQYFLTYDTKHLIPNVRMSVASTVMYDKMMDFYGFNGYQANYIADSVNFWKKEQKDAKKGKYEIDMPFEYTAPFYRMERLAVTAKADFVGKIIKDKFYWQASYAFAWYRYRPINKLNKKNEPIYEGETLYEKYINWGIIPELDRNKGAISSALRLGLMYDTRDFEAAPSRGIWTEGHVTIAPKFMGTTDQYFRYMLIFRHYVPIVKEQLTFAYRLNYQGTIGKNLPFYIMPVFSTIGREFDRDGIGGYRTIRGIMRDRLQGLDVGYFNAEFRWRFVRFTLWKQNVALGLNAFCDGGIVTRNYDVSFRPDIPETDPNYSNLQKDYDKYTQTMYIKTNGESNKVNFKDSFHAAAGGGFRIIINQNFIIAVDYAMPFNKQDGKGSLYINTGYLF